VSSPQAQPSPASTGRRDMRNDVLLAAAELLATQGPSGFSVRAVAGAAGCSTISVYHYFTNKQGLIDAIYLEAFERLAAIQTPPGTTDPVEVVWSISMGLRRMAVEQPAYYRVMFSPSVPDVVPSPASRAPARSNYQRYLSAVRAWAASEPLRVEPEVAAHILWSAGHGLLMVELAGLGPRIDGEAAFRTTVRVIMDGLRGTEVTSSVSRSATRSTDEESRTG